jgi:hypothetical protein
MDNYFLLISSPFVVDVDLNSTHILPIEVGVDLNMDDEFNG